MSLLSLLYYLIFKRSTYDMTFFFNIEIIKYYTYTYSSVYEDVVTTWLNVPDHLWVFSALTSVWWGVTRAASSSQSEQECVGDHRWSGPDVSYREPLGLRGSIWNTLHMGDSTETPLLSYLGCEAVPPTISLQNLWASEMYHLHCRVRRGRRGQRISEDGVRRSNFALVCVWVWVRPGCPPQGQNVCRVCQLLFKKI